MLVLRGEAPAETTAYSRRPSREAPPSLRIRCSDARAEVSVAEGDFEIKAARDLNHSRRDRRVTPLIPLRPALTEVRLSRKVRRFVGLTGERVPGKGQVEHGRRAPNARYLLLLSLLTAHVGCSWIGVRPGFDHGTPDPEQVARNQEFSEHAQEAIDRGDYQQARIELLQLASEVPSSAEAKQRLGMVLQLEGKLAEAEACYRAALQRDPDYVEALIGLGQVEAQQGQILPALTHVESAIEIDPQRPRGHFSLGRLLETQGRTDEALAEYFRALELEPTNAEVSLSIAAIQLSRNQADQALSRLDQAVELAPENGEAPISAAGRT